MGRWSIRGVLVSTEFCGAMLFILAAGFPPFDDITEVDLTLHMLQHVLIIVAGVLIAYPSLGRRMLKEGHRRSAPGLALAITVVIIVFWHLPGPWDAAVLDPLIHVVEHLSFLLVGIACGSWLLLLSDSGKIGALMAAFFGHMGYAVVLISPWNARVYSLYTLPNQVTLGWVLLLTGPLIVVGVAYVIARNPDWLGGYFPPGARVGVKRQTFLNRAKVPRWVSPALTIVFAATLVGYFGATAYALATAGPPAGGSPTVYVTETPVSWQFSPQSVKVVVGVNATITWVSRSISYDTVTDRGGAFGSPPISPGGTFSYTFTKPGVYQYYCLYHPWMTGTVTVLARVAP